MSKTPYAITDAVVFVDLNQKFYGFMYPIRGEPQQAVDETMIKYQLTGIQFIQRLIDLIQSSTTNMKMGIFMMDFKQYIPKEKSLAWKKRKRTDAPPPYPLDFMIQDNEMVDVMRLLVSGDIGRQIIVRYILTKTTYFHPFEIDIILDIDPINGPYQYNKHNGLFMKREDFTIPTTSLLGEPDLRQYFHISQHQFTSIVCMTEDSDHFPVTLSYLYMNTNWPTKLIWQKPGKSETPTLWYDMIQMYRDFQTTSDIPLYILLCILGGTDFFDKGMLTAQFGLLNDILPTLLDYWNPYLRQSFMAGDKKWIYIFLIYLWFRKSKAPQRELQKLTSYDQLEGFRARTKLATPKFKIPTRESVELAFTLIQFNWKYWTEVQQMERPVRLIQEEEKKEEVEEETKLDKWFRDWTTRLNEIRSR